MCIRTEWLRSLAFCTSDDVVDPSSQHRVCIHWEEPNSHMHPACCVGHGLSGNFAKRAYSQETSKWVRSYLRNRLMREHRDISTAPMNLPRQGSSSLGAFRSAKISSGARPQCPTPSRSNHQHNSCVRFIEIKLPCWLAFGLGLYGVITGPIEGMMNVRTSCQSNTRKIPYASPERKRDHS